MPLTTSRFERSFLANPPLSRAWASIVIVAGLLVVGIADWATDAAPVQHLYYLPIMFSGVRFGYRGGLASAVTAVAMYHLANPALHGLGYHELDLVEIALFLLFGVVAARMRADARRVQALAMTDDLTGLHNLRSFEARVHQMIAASRDRAATLSLFVLDVDRLKALNDTHGHLTGADAVRTVGRLIAECLPPDAVACRYGGDEFAVALFDRPEAEVMAIADRLRDHVHASAPVLAGRPFPAATLSVSIGIASGMPALAGQIDAALGDEEAAERLFRAADRALYVAKGSGRNRVATA